MNKTDDAKSNADRIEAFIESFALSKQEARLSLELASGASLKQAAHNIGIQYETARSYLKTIFAKTDCNSQMALVLKIHQHKQ